MVILHKKNVPSMSRMQNNSMRTPRTLKDLVEDPKFLEAAEKIQKG